MPSHPTLLHEKSEVIRRIFIHLIFPIEISIKKICAGWIFERFEIATKTSRILPRWTIDFYFQVKETLDILTGLALSFPGKPPGEEPQTI